MPLRKRKYNRAKLAEFNLNLDMDSKATIMYNDPQKRFRIVNSDAKLVVEGMGDFSTLRRRTGHDIETLISQAERDIKSVSEKTYRPGSAIITDNNPDAEYFVKEYNLEYPQARALVDALENDDYDDEVLTLIRSLPGSREFDLDTFITILKSELQSFSGNTD
tara:strand:- start:159492 stop:159980 length:489 start_codon:yes stop_codon:yes gene_type:complete